MRLAVSWEQDADDLATVSKISEHIIWLYVTAICLQVSKTIN